ncbi:hypothetical protein NADE_006520 [Nannochloris sp. 'desiccata']|nr:hypothetical protein NADE_006520 [Chlorella desiccata (nom. nud.)]
MSGGEDQMLYSTSHQLQTVSLLYYTDPSGAISTLEALAAQEDTQPAVLALATTLLQQNNEGSSFASISNLTASEYIKRYKIESSSGSAPRPQTVAPSRNIDSLESLGISELPDTVYSIRSASKGPLLPKDERAAIEALKQQAQVDHLEQLAALVTPAEISAAATHNPELASEVITVALEISEGNLSLSSWAGASLWAMAASETTAVNNLITCWAFLLDKLDAVEPSALAAFISYSIQRIISIEFISQEVCATLYAKLAAMGSLGVPVMTISVKRYTTELNRGFAFSLFYTLMNVAALSQGLLLDVFRLTFKDGFHIGSLDSNHVLNNGTRLFVASGCITSIAGLVITFFLTEPVVATAERKSRPHEKIEDDSGADAALLLGDQGESFTSTPRVSINQPFSQRAADIWGSLRIICSSRGFLKFMVMCLLSVNVKSLFRHLDATLPKYQLREFVATTGSVRKKVITKPAIEVMQPDATNRRVPLFSTLITIQATNMETVFESETEDV